MLSPTMQREDQMDDKNYRGEKKIRLSFLACPSGKL